MKISKGKETAVNVIIDGQLMEQIGKFCQTVLLNMIENDAKCHAEIQMRIAMKNMLSIKKELHVTRGKLNKNQKKRIII